MIYYRVVKRQDPASKTPKFYAQAKQQSFINLEQVASNISSKTTFTIHDVKGVLSALQEEVILALRDGKGVRLGDLGSFHTTLQSHGAATKEAFTTANLTHLRVRFARSAKMCSALNLANKHIQTMNLEKPETTEKE